MLSQPGSLPLPADEAAASPAPPSLALVLPQRYPNRQTAPVGSSGLPQTFAQLTLQDGLPPAPAGTISGAEGTGEIVVTRNQRHVRADPLSGLNAASFDAVQAVDKAIVAPVAGGYEKVVPKPVRNGLRNFLINLAEPVVFINYLLQFKPGKAMETAGRFAINSTIGVAGLFDMAKRKPFHLPYRENGFANTFAYHGVKNGAYLFLPIIGPTTVRDLIGRILDLSVLPTVIGKPFNTPVYSLGTGTVKALNDRVAFDEQIDAQRAATDPYVATRDFYLKRRQAEVNALHSAAWRARKGIPDPVLPPIAPHVDKNAAPGSPDAAPQVSIPGSSGLTPAAPAPEAPVSGTPQVSVPPATAPSLSSSGTP
ncbi:VacJ family lipoprotein [Novosphingobium sp. 9]|uniref:MlaA family lipoprotein n=1 Tax=Novosphingobium sp. 9 TaxID=2025349 RepID=UPI0021B68540|nr:VacJ family lipoprotein [Novosphingobium sp. 9]